MAHLRVQHAFQGSSGLSEDRYVNVFHLQAPDLYLGLLEGIADAVVSFYDDTPTGQPYPIIHFINTGADAAGRSLKIYDMASPMPRAPKLTRILGTAGFNSTVDNLPEELAMCLSYAAGPTSGVPVARRRGRIYIGPLTLTCMTSGSDLVQARPSTTANDVLRAAGKDLATDLAALNVHWSVWSPTDSALRLIDFVSTDNAFDIQRRRGHAATQRITLAV